MNLFVVGMSHHQTPLALREAFSFSVAQANDFLTKLQMQGFLEGILLVSTCNRVEVYASSQDVNASEKLRNALKSHASGATLEDAMIYEHHNLRTIEHLFKVVSSLDSLVVGEPQILGQIKEAYFLSKSQNFLDAWLERLLQKAFSVAKKIRNETEIGQRAVSISYVAVTLAKKIFSDMSKRNVLILGAGEMAELCAQHLKALQPKSMTFATRTFQNAFDLAQMYGGVAVPLESLQQHLDSSDITIVSTSADSYVITPDQVEKAMRARRQEPMFFIDISVPRNIDPRINEIDDVYLYNIDDLQSIAHANREIRKNEAEKALDLIARESEKTHELLKKLDFGFLIKRFKDNAQQMQSKEIERIQKSLKHLSQEEIDVITKAMNSYADKILHAPIRFLTQSRDTDLSKSKAELFLEFFEMNGDTPSPEDV